MAKNRSEIDESEKEFETTDQGFAAYLATKYMFLGSVDTGEKMGRGQYGNKKALIFLIPITEDMERVKMDYELGTDDTKVPAVVMFNKMRLMRQACQKPYNAGVKA